MLDVLKKIFMNLFYSKGILEVKIKYWMVEKLIFFFFLRFYIIVVIIYIVVIV